MDEVLHRAFQNELVDKPDAGDLIEGTGGLRKVRWRASARPAK
jgi:hypothetical protein